MPTLTLAPAAEAGPPRDWRAELPLWAVLALDAEFGGRRFRWRDRYVSSDCRVGDVIEVLVDTQIGLVPLYVDKTTGRVG